MKLFALVLMLFSLTAQADMAGIDVGFGGGKPFYGFDYEFVKDQPRTLGDLLYLDLAMTQNSDYKEPYASFGLQYGGINMGIAQAVQFPGQGSAQYIYGPELGIYFPTSDRFYIKENNTYMGNKDFSYACTLSFGINL
jgi:hypothetical protein